ncbi:hypothetical protein ACFLVH_00245 [Chloroflexota bacterium]
MKRLLLFETAAQLKKLLRRFAADNPGNILVALSPEADYAGECSGLSYRQIEDFYNEAELIALGIENYKVVGDFCDTLDQLLKSHLSDIPEIKYISAHQSFHAWKILFDAILNRTFALKAAIDNFKPDEIVSFKDVSMEGRDGFGFLSGSAFRSLVPVVAEHYHIKLIQMPAAMLDWQSLIGYRQRASWLLHRFSGGWRIANALTRLTQRHSTVSSSDIDKEQLKFKKERPVLVVTEMGYDIAYVVEKWQSKNIGPVIMLTNKSSAPQARAPETQALRKRLTKMWATTECRTRLAPYFNINGMDCYPVAYPRLHYFLFRFLPRSLNWVRFVHGVLSKLEKCIVLNVLEPVICEVARRLGIPSVTYQHGGFVGYMDAPIFEYVNLYPNDYFFCYGEDIVKFLAEPVPSAHRSPDKHRAKPIAIGSAALDAMAQVKDKIPSNHPQDRSGKYQKVIYVPSSLFGDQRYHTNYIYPDIWYWRLQQEIIKILGHFPEIQLIAKLHPRDIVKNPIYDWFRKNPLPNVKIIRDTPFIKLLHEADLFIMDHPSTTLVQALTTNKKIILYNDRTFFRFDPQAAELVRKRVLFSETREQFLKDIESVLGEEDWALPEPTNDEFLKAYGTYINDGGSAGRAVQVLINLAEGI